MIRPRRLSALAYTVPCLVAGLLYDLIILTVFHDSRPPVVFWGLGITVGVVMLVVACIDERRPRRLWERRRG